MRFQYGLARLSVRDDDGVLSFQPDYQGDPSDESGDKGGGGPALESIHPFGFLSRPRDPDVDADGQPTKGCTLMFGWDGPEGWSLPTQDPRDLAKLPTTRPGESIMYGSAGQFVRCHEDGGVTLFVTHDGTTDGQPIYLKLSPTAAGKPYRGGLDYASPWGRIQHGPTGFRVVCGGAVINAGNLGGMPAPLDALSSQIQLQAHTISLNASVVDVGTDSGVGNEAASAALAAFCTAVGAAIAASSDPGMAASKPAVAAALATVLSTITKLGKFG